MYSVSVPNWIPPIQTLDGTFGGGIAPPPPPSAGGDWRGNANAFALVMGDPVLDVRLKPAVPTAKAVPVGEPKVARPSAPAPVSGCSPNSQFSPGTAQLVLALVGSRGTYVGM